MFYIKHNGEEIEIDQDSIMTRCLQCGRELPVAHEMMFEQEFDWYGTSFFCNTDCANKWKMLTFHELLTEMSEAERPHLRLLTKED